MAVQQVNLVKNINDLAQLSANWVRLFRLLGYWLKHPILAAKTLASVFLHKRSIKSQYWWCLPRSSRIGVNVIGFIDGEFGLGVMARSVLADLDRAGIPYRIVANEVRSHGFVRSEFHSKSRFENFSVNLAVTTPDRWQIDALRLFGEVDLRLPTIAYVAWELEGMSTACKETLKLFDQVWGISDFCAEQVCKPVGQSRLKLPINIDVPKDLQPIDLSELGLNLVKDDVFLVGYCFDAASFVERKNPIDAVLAFQAAYPEGARDGVKMGKQPHLILKTHNTNLAVNQPHWKNLVKLVALDDRIHILDIKLSSKNTWMLLAAFDCYLSLHRAEGLGLTVGEALALGKPTVCTAYGGVMDYAHIAGFIGIDYKLISIEAGQYVAGSGLKWAAPEWKQAAQKLSMVYKNA